MEMYSSLRTFTQVSALSILAKNKFFIFAAKGDGLEFKKGGTEIGKNLAEKSKGLFSADDWQCKT